MIVMRQPGTPRTSPSGAPVPSLEQMAEALPLDALSWQDRGLCREVDAEVFFPELGMSSNAAKRICALCPVRASCLKYAVETRQRFGVWGGTSEHEREAMWTGRKPVPSAA